MAGKIPRTSHQPVVTFHPATSDRWDDLASLFGPKGATAGCWCMFWRQTQAEFTRGHGEANRRALEQLAASSRPPGILAYAGAAAVGWCAVAPRSEYTRLGRSRVLKPLDAEPVWSIVCFFVARTFRRKGLTVQLLRAAVAFARSHGARIVEGYPVEPAQGSIPDVFAYTGLASAFRRAGFKEVARRSPTRPFMRCVLGPGKAVRPAAQSTRSKGQPVRRTRAVRP